MLADRQSDRQTDGLITIPRSPTYWGGVIKDWYLLSGLAGVLK